MAALSVGAAAQGQASAPLRAPQPQVQAGSTPPRAAILTAASRAGVEAARPRPHARARPACTCRPRAPPAGPAAAHSPRRPLTARQPPSRRRTPGPAGACAPRATQ